ncbi:MAG: hypothetical protein AAGI68_16050 [Planctomycetota bacterium]
MQTGGAAGLWTRSAEAYERDNGGVVIRDREGAWWVRACDPSRVEARWFGVKADGSHDDGPALQRAIDSLPAAGGVVLLPTGRMRCGASLRIGRSHVTIQGANCGLLSKLFEPGKQVGQGSLLVFDAGVDGIVIEAEPGELDRLGGITLREFGIAGTGRSGGQTGIKVLCPAHRTWGSTDALLLERLYVIECQWCAYLKHSDAGIINQCWFSECGNGLHLDACIYTVVQGPCFADNDGLGLLMTGGHGNEIASGVFVRNKEGLVIQGARTTRVNGGVFGSDTAGSIPRQDTALIRVTGESELAVTGASFTVTGQPIAAGIAHDASSRVEHAGCQVSGELSQVMEGD